MIGIYKITSPSNKVYIGQTTNYAKRYSAYKNHKCKRQPKLYNSLNKYGFENHKIELILECLESELNYYERYYQEYYNSVLDGLNLRYTATTDKSGFMSNETKQKMSDSKKGIVFTDEWKENLGKVWKGRKHTEETKLKMSLASKGKKKSSEHIAKLWQNQKGAKMPKRSEATKQLQSLNNGKNRAVLQYDLDMNFIAEYRSAMEATRQLGISRNITSCCQGKLKQSGGFIWRYKNS
jgi:group I intron endonuclease